MSQVQFKVWREKNPYIEDYLYSPDGKDCRWGRIHAEWHEKHGRIDLTHICTFTLDIQNGEIYFDCTKLKIWTKFLFLTVGRPLTGLTKTVYHLALPISLPAEIFKAVYKGIHHQDSVIKIAGHAWTRVFHSIIDIVRTPIYIIALTIISAAAVITGPLAPQKLYDWRALAGRIENSLCRGEESWVLAPCFQPFGNIAEMKNLSYVKNDTDYDLEATLHGLNNLVRSYVKYRREVCNPFDDCGRRVKADAAYISPSYSS